MNRTQFRVTFATWTHDSREAGEPVDSGIVVESGTLSDVMPHLTCGSGDWRNAPIAQADCSEGRPRWIDFDDYRDDYVSGERENRALHIPDGITDASAVRIARLFGARP